MFNSGLIWPYTFTVALLWKSTEARPPMNFYGDLWAPLGSSSRARIYLSKMQLAAILTRTDGKNPLYSGGERGRKYDEGRWNVRRTLDGAA